MDPDAADWLSSVDEDTTTTTDNATAVGAPSEETLSSANIPSGPSVLDPYAHIVCTAFSSLLPPTSYNSCNMTFVICIYIYS